MVVQISPEIESQIEAFARRTGESKDELVRKALLSYLEDRQDALRAAERVKNIGARISLDEIGRKYGRVLEEEQADPYAPEVLDHLRQGMAEADRGEFVPQTEIEAFFDDWRRNG